MKIDKNIIAIGGGGSKHNASIYRYAVSLTKKKNPRALLIPTAAPGKDPASAWNNFQEYFAFQLNCQVDILDLLFKKYTKLEIEKLVLSADLIYVSGGNTLRLVTVLKNYKVSRLLQRAYHQGTVLMGESAGAICWHDYGHSDSRRELNPKNWKYICVAGFGYFPGIFCPHYTKIRGKDFQAMLIRKKMMGLAFTDFAGIHYRNEEYQILKSKPSGSGYIINAKHKKVLKKKIKADGIFRSVESIFKI